MKVVIVGCGGLGHVHAEAYTKRSDVTLVGVCDTNPEAADTTAEAFATKAFYSFEEMLAQTDCDVVSITLPSFLHKTFTIKAAQAGKHVICEKPIALSLEDAAEMMAVCEENNVKLFVGHVVRFFPEYAQLKEFIDNGSIGQVGTAHLKRAGNHPGERRPWFADESKSGGVVPDLMIHDIDFLRWSLGEARSVYGLRHVDQDALFDYATATIIFENGAVANVEAHWGHLGPFLTSSEFAGSQGLLRSDSSKSSALRIRTKSVEDNASNFVEIPQSSSIYNPFEAEIHHFLDCIAGKETKPLVTAQDAYKALEIALAVIESANTGKAVLLNHANKEEA